MLLMNRPDLILHIVRLRLALPLALWVPVVAVDSCLLPSRELIFGYFASSHWIKDIVSLTGEALEVVGDIHMRDRGAGVTRICLGLLLFPPGVQKFDYE